MKYTLVPANAEPVGARLSVDGTPTFASAGQVFFVTITEPDISMLDWFVTRNNDAARFRTELEKNPDNRSEQQINQRDSSRMRSARTMPCTSR